jgi:hypothetical protein
MADRKTRKTCLKSPSVKIQAWKCDANWLGGTEDALTILDEEMPVQQRQLATHVLIISMCSWRELRGNVG